MNFFAFSALFNGTAALLFGLFIVLRNPRGSASRAFGVLSLSVVVWSFGYFFWQMSDNAAQALFYDRVLMAGAIFIPVAYLHFVLAMIYRLKQKIKLLIFAYALFGVFFVLNFTKLFISGFQQNFYFWSVPGPAFHPFLVLWFACYIYASVLLVKAYKKSEGVNYLFLKYTFIGCFIGFLAGIVNYLPWYGIFVPPFTNILVSVYVVSLIYPFIKVSRL